MAEKDPHQRSWFDRARTLRDQSGPLESALWGIGFIGLVLLFWHILTMGDVPEERILSPTKLPSLGETLRSFPELWYERGLSRGILWSLSRVLGGFLLAASIAVPLGILAGCFPRLNAFLRPFSVFGRSVPVAALIGLMLVWFGSDEEYKIMFIFCATIAFIFFDATHSVENVSSRFVDTAQTLGAKVSRKTGVKRALIFAFVYAFIIVTAGSMMIQTSWSDPFTWGISAVGAAVGFILWYPIQSHQVLQKVLVPLALPSIVNSLRLLFGIAFGYVMLAEMISAKYGLGYIINNSQRRGKIEHIFLVLIIIALVAFTIDRCIYWCQKRWFPYKEFP